MATDLEKLVVRIEANLTQFEKAFAKSQGITTRELRKIETQAMGAAGRIEKAMGRVGGAFKGFAAGAIGALGFQQLATAAQSAIKSIADIGDAATKLGLTTDEYQELAFAAQLAGVETSALAAGMKKLAVNSSEAARGNGTLGEILKLNNISIKDANGNLLSQTEIMKRVAELVRNAASEQDQAAIAQAAFGKSGIELMGILQDGAAGVAAAMGAAKEDTIKFTAEQIAAAQRFDDEIDTLINTVSVGLKGAFIDAAVGVESFAGSAIANLDAVGVKVGGLGEALASISRYLPGIGAAIQFGEAAVARGKTVQAQNKAPTSSSGKVDLPKLNANPTKLPVQPLSITTSPRTAAPARKSNLVETAVRERDAVADLIQQLKFEGDQLRRSDLQQQISSELRRAGTTATQAQKDAIIASVTANYNYAQSQDAAKLSEESRLERMTELRDAQMELASTFVDAMDAIIVQGQSADEVLKNLVKTLASQALQGLFLGQGPLGSLFGASKGGGIFGSLFGGLAGARAAGGPVSGGKSYLVGEKGPEIFRPSGSGSIVPNSKVGGTSLVFAPVITAPNADKMAIAALQAQLHTMKRDFTKMVTGSVSRERNLNPGFG